MKRKQPPSAKRKRYYQTMIGDDRSGVRAGKYKKVKFSSRRR